MKMYTIQVDFEVYKRLTIGLDDENDTYNNVLRRLMSLKVPAETKSVSTSSGIPWVIGEVTIPHGTEFRRTYKGRLYEAKAENGAMVYNNKKFFAPSTAAGEITNNSVDGWKWWYCRLPGETDWKVMDSLRK